MKISQVRTSLIGKRVKCYLLGHKLSVFGTITDIVKNVIDDGKKILDVEKGVEVYFDSNVYIAGRCYPFMEFTAKQSTGVGPLEEVELLNKW